jgi:hypothetical protein
MGQGLTRLSLYWKSNQWKYNDMSDVWNIGFDVRDRELEDSKITKTVLNSGIKVLWKKVIAKDGG